MSDTEKDVIYPEELYIKEEDPEKLDIKEESVEYCAEGDEECEYKFIPLPSLKEETGDGSITGSQSAASVCKETNFGIFQEAKTKEEVEYRASCDTTVGYQHTLTEQEDLPQSEGKRTSTTKTEIRRRRNQNWTADQTLLLVHLVKEKKDIIKGRFSPNLTYKDKKDAWKQITKDINYAFPSVVRTVQQVEKRWYNCYQKGKEDILARKRLISETGAGPPDQIVQVSDPIIDIIEKIMRPNCTSIGVNTNNAEHIMNITGNRGKKESMQTGGGDPLEVDNEETAKILSTSDDRGNDVNSDTRQTVAVFDCDGDLVEHSYAMPKCSSSMATNITKTTTQHTTTFIPSQHTATLTASQHTTTLTPSQHTTTLTASQHTATLIPSQHTPTLTTQHFTAPPLSQPTTTLTAQDHPAAARLTHSYLAPWSTAMSRKRKRRRGAKFTKHATLAPWEMRRREHELNMKNLELNIELKKEALSTVQKFNKVADLLLEKFK